MPTTRTYGDSLLESFKLREGNEPADALVRSMQKLKIIDDVYKDMYGGLAEVRDKVRESAENTDEVEAELAKHMRETVLLIKFLKRREQTTINEIVPGAFPPVDVAGGPTSSPDFDCGDAKAAAHAICVTVGRFWPYGTGACIAAQVAAALAC